MGASTTPAAELRPDDVSRVTFSASLFRSGYDQAAVDTFLDQVVGDLTVRWRAVDATPSVAATMSRPRPRLTPTAIGGQLFPLTKFRQGYRSEQVDQLLDRVAENHHPAGPSAPGGPLPE